MTNWLANKMQCANFSKQLNMTFFRNGINITFMRIERTYMHTNKIKTSHLTSYFILQLRTTAHTKHTFLNEECKSSMARISIRRCDDGESIVLIIICIYGNLHKIAWHLSQDTKPSVPAIRISMILWTWFENFLELHSRCPPFDLIVKTQKSIRSNIQLAESYSMNTAIFNVSFDLSTGPFSNYSIKILNVFFSKRFQTFT